MKDKMRSTLIGLFVIVGILVLTSILIFLRPSFGDEKFTLRVQFPNVEKINVGTRVTYAGKPVGQVRAVHLIEGAKATALNGVILSYELTLALDSKIHLLSTDRIQSQTSGLLGERTIAIVPQPPTDLTRPILNGELICAYITPSMEDSFQSFARIASNAEVMMTQLSNILNVATPEINSTLIDVAAASKSFKQLTEAISNQGTLDDIKSAAQSAAHAMENFNKIVEHVHSGQGSLGRVLMQDDLYLNFSQALARASIVLSDINNYGLLFNYNRTWKSQRVYQMEKISNLSNPKSFEKFWNSQLQTMHINLSQLSTMLEGAKRKQLNEGSLNFQKFDSSFAKIIREIDQLHEQLCLFREQIHTKDSFVIKP
jgi:phospholipid/cholesterol/gamma-HCH transport system substrate-binding protein